MGEGLMDSTTDKIDPPDVDIDRDSLRVYRLCIPQSDGSCVLCGRKEAAEPEEDEGSQ